MLNKSLEASKQLTEVSIKSFTKILEDLNECVNRMTIEHIRMTSIIQRVVPNIKFNPETKELVPIIDDSIPILEQLYLVCTKFLELEQKTYTLNNNLELHL